MNSLPQDASNHTRSALNSSQEISAFIQVTDRLFQAALQPPYPSGGFSLCHEVACSKAWATFRSVSSPNGLPSSCSPMGSLAGWVVNPHGRLNPQMPARLQDRVKMSERYICKGSSDFSPILKAGVGVVGVTMTSTFSKAFKKSWRISVRTFCA